MKRIRTVLSSAVFIIVIGVFFVLNLAVPSPEILEAERRRPAKFPEINSETVLSGTFMSKFEDFAADHFTLRDEYRAINSILEFDVFMKSDMSGLYMNNEIGLGEFVRTDENEFRQSAEKMLKAAQTLSGLEPDINIYYSLIPDKSIYSKNYMPGFDLAAAESILFDVMDGYPYIGISNHLDPSVYYRTDLHWDQTKITTTASEILRAMDAGAPEGGFTVSEAGEFYGLYAGQIALPVPPDILSYADVTGVEASYLSEKTLEFEPGPVYDFSRLNGVDPYDFFLRGPQPLVVLENDTAPQRELYLFRDSFGSSLAPLLTESYSKITLIDLRYLNLALLPGFVSLSPGADVLFIYGSQIFNNPSVLQV